MLFQELEGSDAINGVATLEVFNTGSVAKAVLGVEPADFGVFVSDPLVGGDAVMVAPLDVKRARKNEGDCLGVVERVSHVPVGHFPFD